MAWILLGRANKAGGSKNGSSKLSENQIKIIRSEYKNGGIFQRELAARFGVLQNTISRILNYKRWGHING